MSVEPRFLTYLVSTQFEVLRSWPAIVNEMRVVYCFNKTTTLS